MSNLNKSIELTPELITRAHDIVLYVQNLKDLFGNYIVRANLNDAPEKLKIPEHVRRSFRFHPLFSPILTFAVDYYPDTKDEWSLGLLKTYLDLENLFEYIRSTSDLDKLPAFRPFFANNDLTHIDFALEQMYHFLQVCTKHIANIYSFAVSYFYGTDLSSSVDYKDLSQDYPYIVDRSVHTSSGVMFAYFLVASCELFYAPKLNS